MLFCMNQIWKYEETISLRIMFSYCTLCERFAFITSYAGSEYMKICNIKRLTKNYIYFGAYF